MANTIINRKECKKNTLRSLQIISNL